MDELIEEKRNAIESLKAKITDWQSEVSDIEYDIGRAEDDMELLRNEINDFNKSQTKLDVEQKDGE